MPGICALACRIHCPGRDPHENLNKKFIRSGFLTVPDFRIFISCVSYSNNTFNKALMKTVSKLTLLFIFFVAACTQSKSPTGTFEYKQITIKEANATPTVNIKEYTLITSNKNRDSADAIEILELKRKLPLAMQGKDSVLFESILSKNFTYRGEDEFYKNKEDYIHNRIHASWTIDTVKYQNLVLQFFDGIAILTYRNTLNGTDDKGKAEIEHYSWTDIYVKENNKWKIKGIHEIESRVEYPK